MLKPRLLVKYGKVDVPPPKSSAVHIFFARGPLLCRGFFTGGSFLFLPLDISGVSQSPNAYSEKCQAPRQLANDETKDM